MSDPSTQLTDLTTQERRALLERLLREKAAKPKSFPLSFAQQRLWILNQLQPDSPAYNVPIALRLEGHLDIAALERTLSEVIRRHQSLRTTFATTDGQPAQVIHLSQPVTLPVVDLSGMPNEVREANALQWIDNEARQPFDLSRGPLLRQALLRLGEEEYVLLLNMHHIVSDGWSMGVLMREVAALYEAFTSGAPSPLPELEIQYADYAVWQREWLQGEVLDQQLAYWRQQLADAPTVLALPTDSPRTHVPSYHGAYESVILSQGLTEEIKQFSQQQGLTLFMTLLAVFQVLLMRYSGQSEIVVGTPVANRTRGETEALIGFFVNTLALRVSLAGESNWRQLLQQVREVAVGAYAHQELPFEKLVEELQPVREMSHQPLFQVMMVLQNAPQEEMALRSLKLSAIGVDTNTAKFDLTLSLEESSDRLYGRMEYCTDLFEAATIRRLLQHYQRLLEEMVANPDQRVAQAQMLTERERYQLVFEWNQTQQDYGDELCLAQLFEAQVERRPEGTAVVFAEEQLTYGELNRRANQLAHYLRQLGVGAEVAVGICMERSVEMVVGLLGILKAGGAYLPLDPGYPRERLSYMMEDAGIGLVLTQQHLLGVMAVEAVEVICLDHDWQLMAGQGQDNLGSESRMDNLAYVTYTSGSTGRPKGVGVPQRGVRRLVERPNYVELSGDGRILQLAPLAFDASTFEIWGSLLNGGRLVMMGAEQPTLEEIGETLERQGVTTMWLTAGLFHLMVEEQLERLGGVRQLLAGGDVVSVWHVEKLRQRWPECVVINGYGPTENTTFTACHRVEVGEELGSSVPIGRGVTNTQVYVVDGEMEVVAVGVVGELYTGGEGLARGYVSGAAETAERFVPDGLSGEQGRRLYRTGDLVRYVKEGRLEYVGRRDEQVKVRGYRIELGEVETVLREHSGVSEAVVVVREDVATEKRIVAYVVAREAEGTTAAGQEAAELEVAILREYLKARLPAYMVPSAIVQLAELPLTAHGKVDRRALPEADTARSEMDTAYVAPRNLTEQTVANIYAQALGIEKVGIHDNFFMLGGHSLLATRVISRIREAFQVEMPLRHIFETPTVAGLTVAIVQVQSEQLGSEEVSKMLAEINELSEDEAQALTNQ
jgi:aspartate racemase